VRTQVRINEIHNFSKFEVTGVGAEDWLNRLMANTMPQNGRIVLRPMEMGLERFVRYGKADFIGRDTATADRGSPPDRRLNALIVDASDADVSADGPIFHDGTVVGFVTSSGYAHFSRKSIALGMVPREIADDGEHFEFKILGERRAETLTTTPILDPQGLRMRI
jgi:dimethylglycine dehydrogenase